MIRDIVVEVWNKYADQNATLDVYTISNIKHDVQSILRSSGEEQRVDLANRWIEEYVNLNNKNGL